MPLEAAVPRDAAARGAVVRGGGARGLHADPVRRLLRDGGRVAVGAGPLARGAVLVGGGTVLLAVPRPEALGVLPAAHVPAREGHHQVSDDGGGLLSSTF